MARYGRGSGADFKEVLSAGMDVLRDNGLRLDPNLTLALKSMTQASAFFVPLAPSDRTFTAAAVEAVLEQAQAPSTEAMVKEMVRKEAVKLAGQAAHAAPDYIKSLLSWNNQFKKGKLTVAVDTSSLNEQVVVLRSVASMIVVALLVAGGVIGSAIAASAFAGTGGAMERYAQWGFFGSLLLGAVLVVIFTVRTFRSSGPDRR